MPRGGPRGATWRARLARVRDLARGRGCCRGAGCVLTGRDTRLRLRLRRLWRLRLWRRRRRRLWDPHDDPGRDADVDDDEVIAALATHGEGGAVLDARRRARVARGRGDALERATTEEYDVVDAYRGDETHTVETIVDVLFSRAAAIVCDHA